MKKTIIFLLAIALLFVVAPQETQAQGKTELSFVAYGDSITASRTIYSKAVYVKSPVLCLGTYELDTDSVSGTPGYTATVEYSVGGTNWFDDANFADVTTAVAGQDTAFTVVNSTGLYGNYIRVKIVANSTTQKSTPTGWVKWYEKR